MDALFEKRWEEVTANANEFIRLQQIYEKEKGKKPNCGDCLYKFFNFKVRRLKSKNKTIMKTTYKLKKGAVVYFNQKKVHITETTLTDKLAKEYLLANPSGIRYFEHAPIEADEIVNDVPVIPVDAVEPEKKRGRKKSK